MHRLFGIAFLVAISSVICFWILYPSTPREHRSSKEIKEIPTEICGIYTDDNSYYECLEKAFTPIL